MNGDHRSQVGGDDGRRRPLRAVGLVVDQRQQELSPVLVDAMQDLRDVPGLQITLRRTILPTVTQCRLRAILPHVSIALEDCITETLI